MLPGKKATGSVMINGTLQTGLTASLGTAEYPLRMAYEITAFGDGTKETYGLKLYPKRASNLTGFMSMVLARLGL